MRILIVAMQFPAPPDTGERIRNYNLLRRLAKNHEIHLLSLISRAEERRSVAALESQLSSVDTVLLPRRSKVGHLPGILRRMLSGDPMDTHFYFLPEMVRKVRAVLSRQEFDIVQFEHSYMGSYLDVLSPDTAARKVVTFIDVESSRLARLYKLDVNLHWRARHLLNWLFMKRWEKNIATRADMCITTSDLDKSLLRSITGAGNVLVVPNGVDCQALTQLPSDAARNDILFVGTFEYSPNVDAAQYLVGDVLPNVARLVPDARCVLVGSHPPAAVERLADDVRVTVTGWVEDVRPYYERCAVCAVPLRAGGGTRLKILEAMALGRPVVSTSLGCEGIDVTDGVDILIADRPEHFAAAIAKLLLDGDLRRKLSGNARALVEKKYGWDEIAGKLSSAYEDLVAGGRLARS